MPSSAGQMRRPPSGAPCELHYVTRSAERLECGCHLCNLPIPFLGQERTSVVAAAPLPPLVVLGRTSSVIRSLFREESIVVHWKSLSPHDAPHAIAPLDSRLQVGSVAALNIYFAGPLFTPYERSFIDDCADALRADGFEVFVPHEHELTGDVDVTAWIFAKDRPGIERADALLAILDGPSVDDGTACEIGMFHALMQSDPSKKGIVGLLTDIRGMRGESTGVNLFVKGAIEDVGQIVASIDEARDVLRAWRQTAARS